MGAARIERNSLNTTNQHLRYAFIVKRNEIDPFWKRIITGDEKWIVCNNVKRYFTESRDSCSIASLQERLESHAGLLDSFRKLQDRIDSLVEGTDCAATHEADRETFETAYFDLMASVEEYIRDSRPASTPELPASPLSSPYMSSANIDTRLPIIQLPSFDGNFND